VSTNDHHLSEPTTADRPPSWFRFAVITLATLVLCSCQAVGPSTLGLTATKGQDAPLDSETPIQPLATASDQPLMAEATHQGTVQQVSHEAVGFPHQASGCPLPASCPCQCGPARSNIYPADEYLCDGGDGGVPVAVRKNWQIDGLEQEDTVAHYDTVDGKTVTTPSNRVCIYAPRFAAVRKVIDLQASAGSEGLVRIDHQTSVRNLDDSEEAASSLALLEPSIHRRNQPTVGLRERQQPGELGRDLAAAEIEGLLAPYANLQIIRTGMIHNEEHAQLSRSCQAAISWTGVQALQITLDGKRAQAEVRNSRLGAVYRLHEPHHPKLRLLKLASTASALPGEEVEFTLRFDNTGNRVIGNVTIVDNLTTRLQLIPDSQTSSVAAKFSAEPNENGSLLLRWEIDEPLEPGQGGVLQFRCKVR